MDTLRDALPSRRRPMAFSLLELTLVVAIVATLGLIAAPRYIGSLSRHRVDMAMRRVEGDLALARSRAIALSASQTIEFDIDPDSTYRIVGMIDPDRPSSAHTVDLRKGPYHVTIVSADFAGDNRVTFNGHGIPNVGGTVLLRSGDHEEKIRITAPLSGVIVD